MTTVVLIILFIIGLLFFNAAHIPAWLLGAGKPTGPHWKAYATIGATIWILLIILANFWL